MELGKLIIGSSSYLTPGLGFYIYLPVEAGRSLYHD